MKIICGGLSPLITSLFSGIARRPSPPAPYRQTDLLDPPLPRLKGKGGRKGRRKGSEGEKCRMGDEVYGWYEGEGR